MKKAKIAVVGGGIAGTTIALYLSEIGLDVKLFEKGTSLVNGPPICHLHAGGNLYREISDEQCVTLLKESIDLVRFYPNAVDYRPTVIAVPKNDSGTPKELYKRLNLLHNEYEALIQSDSKNKVLGDSSHYYKLYDKKELELLREKKAPKKPMNLDDWMIPVAKNIDFNMLQFPLVIVQEYGLNLFRLSASVSLALESKNNCEVLLKHKVTDIKKSQNDTWSISYKNEDESKEECFDFLINAAGFQSGIIDDMLGLKRDRLVEFKAAYVSHWKKDDTLWPEIVFYGERGTPKGMAQFTPYPDGYFQLHGMTKDITLFNEGLVKSSTKSAYPKLDSKLLNKIENTWSIDAAKQRTQLAIKHLAQYIPAFNTASVAAKPLYGAQQIPGDDETLRAAEVSFVDDHYARCEIVKASSVLSMADAITAQLIKLDYVGQNMYKKRDFSTLKILKEEEINKYAKSLCKDRQYPSSLSGRTFTNKTT